MQRRAFTLRVKVSSTERSIAIGWENPKFLGGYRKFCSLRCLQNVESIFMISYWESINWIEISIQYEGDYDLECVPLGWSGSGSVIGDHSDHGRSNEPMNLLWTMIHRFIWSTMIRVISDHWCSSGSSQRNAPLVPRYGCSKLSFEQRWVFQPRFKQ